MTVRMRVVLAVVLVAVVAVAVAVVVVVRPFEVELPLRVAFAGSGRVDPHGTGGRGVRPSVDVALSNDGTEPIRVHRISLKDSAMLADSLYIETRHGGFTVQPGKTLTVWVRASGDCPFDPPASFYLELEAGFEDGEPVVRDVRVGPIPNALQRIANRACDLPAGADLPGKGEVTAPTPN
ncbi:hypothetical protein J2S43_003261 [Catenuloplanes nepalensis]|uniref:Uncharacterized protein n=1 Tax=Catenuloplanes nepalensis TaxID=587533 RepID=A0ABT9MTN9_9ACTN|nr:hypothetical protein [Catenuloplanes nepalensis]MDP9794749.1 hypothetical protein [Catenuloplanes nepalensis]